MKIIMMITIIKTEIKITVTTIMIIIALVAIIIIIGTTVTKLQKQRKSKTNKTCHNNKKEIIMAIMIKVIIIIL